MTMRSTEIEVGGKILSNEYGNMMEREGPEILPGCTSTNQDSRLYSKGVTVLQGDGS